MAVIPPGTRYRAPVMASLTVRLIGIGCPMQVTPRSRVTTTELRHGLGYLWPSEIADQFYCEYKVHLRRLHPEVQIDLPPLELGEASHAALASQAQLITAAELDEAIQTGKKLAICEWVLEGCFQDVRIRGRPDFFGFEGKKALLLLDFKFSDAAEPFRNQEVQVEVYAFLAPSADFATEELCMGIVMFPPVGARNTLREAAQTKAAMLQFLNQNGALQEVHERCEQERMRLLNDKSRRATVRGKGWRAFLYRYDPNRTSKDLNWALQYWLGQREPIPVKRWPRKCFGCPLNAVGLCDRALQQPDPQFDVCRLADGRIFVSRK